MAKHILPKSSDSGNFDLPVLRLMLSSVAPKIAYSISPTILDGPSILEIPAPGAGSLQIVGFPAGLVLALRAVADEIELSMVADRRQVVNIPSVLDDPASAWPFLLSRFPWLFDGIELKSEPYSHYLKGARLADDLELLEPYRGQSLSQADVAGIVFGDRTKTGGSWRRRILAILEHWNTTTPATVRHDGLEIKKAA